MNLYLTGKTLLNGILLSSNNPLDIIRGDNAVDGEGFRLLGMSHFYRIMNKGGVIIAACVLTVTFIGIAWATKAPDIADKKKNLVWILVLLFFFASLVMLFTVAKDVMDAVFF